MQNIINRCRSDGGKVGIMGRKAAAIAILTCISLLCGCSQHSWSSALRLAEITESGIDLSGVTLSEDGAEFFNKITDRLKSDTEDMGQFDIVVQETQMFAADGGYFVEEGYKQAGAVDTQWYEISFLSDGGARALYSGEKQGTTLFAAEGDTLYLLWQDGVLSSLSSTGDLKQLYDLRDGNDDDIFMCINSTMTGDGSTLNISVVFQRFGENAQSRTDTLIYDIDSGHAEYVRGTFQ